VTSPWIHEIKIQNNPIVNGKTWRFVDEQIGLLDVDDAQVLAQCLRNGDSTFEASGWKTLASAKVSQKKKGHPRGCGSHRPGMPALSPAARL